MPQINCKHCGAAFVAATISGTMFCPKCKNAFWLGEKPASAPPASVAVSSRNFSQNRSNNAPWILAAAIGMILIGLAGTLWRQRGQPVPVEPKVARVSAADNDSGAQSLKLEIAKTQASLQELEVQLAVEQRKHETLVWQLESQARLEPTVVRVTAPPPPPSIETAPKPPAGPDFTQIANKASRSVVVVLSGQGGGSGFIVSKDGIVVTNHHVVGDLKTVNVEVKLRDSNDKVRLKNVPVLMADDDIDLALIQLPTAPENVAVDGGYAYVPIREAEPKMSEEVFAVGNPGVTFDYTVTRGVVSDPNRFHPKKVTLQTTATINPGNSGGPLFDMNGGVLGVITLKNIMKESCAYGIPAVHLRQLLERYQVKFKLQ